MVDERVIVNAMVALLATGGSTNHLIHWVAVARAAGILIDWNDFSELSEVVPLLTRVYPNGSADVNEFQAAGGPGFVIGELLDAGLMHARRAHRARRRHRASTRTSRRWRATPRTSTRCAGMPPRRRRTRPSRGRPRRLSAPPAA